MPKSSSFGVPSAGDQNIAGLDVAVDDETLVRGPGPRHRHGRTARAGRESTVAAPRSARVDRFALDVLHHDVRPPVPDVPASSRRAMSG